MSTSVTPGAGSLTPAIFLSPHYDDVVLSCGGTVARLVDAGCKPLMLTIFAGEVPEEMVGEFASWKHSRWKASSADEILAIRRAEDSAAAAVLGCGVRWLGHLDAIYRGGRYASDSGLFGTLQELEKGLVEIIAAEVCHVPEWRPSTQVYVPLGIGNHVDHQLTFRVGCTLAGQGIPVFAYEDCPYAIHTPAGVDKRLAMLRGQVAAPQSVSIQESLPRRLEAIAAYRTQVPVIFRFTSDFRAAVTAHALRTGGSQVPAERYWPVLASAPVCEEPQPRQLTIDVLPTGVVVYRFEGKLDMETADALRHQCTAVVADGLGCLVLDMTQVTFVDSSGLSSMVSGLKAARTIHGDLRLARVSAQLQTLLKLTSLERVFKLYPTVQDAVASYEGKQEG